MSMAEPGTSLVASFVIAIDGPAAAGKGTLARRLAEHLGYAYLDTGSLYRAVGIKTVRAGHDPADAEAAVAAARALVAEDLERPDLRGDEAAQAASQVAAQAGVRQVLLDFQRRFASHPPGGRGAVLDGRDIGTVVCPDAPVKLFVTASLPVRASRRHRELRDRGAAVIHSTVLRDMKERDARDSEREVAPLRPAVDAYVIDTSDLDPDTVLAVALAHVRPRLSTMQNNAQDNARNNAQDNAQDKGGLSLEFPGNPRHQKDNAAAAKGDAAAAPQGRRSSGKGRET